MRSKFILRYSSKWWPKLSGSKCSMSIAINSRSSRRGHSKLVFLWTLTSHAAVLSRWETGAGQLLALSWQNMFWGLNYLTVFFREMGSHVTVIYVSQRRLRNWLNSQGLRVIWELFTSSQWRGSWPSIEWGVWIRVTRVVGKDVPI